MQRQPNLQPFFSNVPANSSAGIGSALHQGAYSSWKHHKDSLYQDAQAQVALENQGSQQISVHMADVAAKAAVRTNRSPGSSA
jgi:uncharacterized protein YycO